MMIRINERKQNVVHESFFGIPTYVDECELHAVTFILTETLKRGENERV